MNELPDDVVRYVARAFAKVEHEEVLDALRHAVMHDGTAPEPRLLRCAAVGARGDLGRLREKVARLKVDYRDVIVEGEYVPRQGKLVRVRNLAEPIPEST